MQHAQRKLGACRCPQLRLRQAVQHGARTVVLKWGLYRVQARPRVHVTRRSRQGTQPRALSAPPGRCDALAHVAAVPWHALAPPRARCHACATAQGASCSDGDADPVVSAPRAAACAACAVRLRLCDALDRGAQEATARRGPQHRRAAGGGRADAHLRCNVPAAAVETCLLRLSSSSTVQEARSGECLELAVAAMAPQTLTRAGFTPESVDTLQCTYLALVGVAHKSEGPTNAALLLSLGALLGAPRDGGAWLRRLMSYDEAPLQQARVHDKEMQLRAMVQETADATDDGADYDVSDAEQLLNAAEALELYGAMRHWGLGTPDEARVRKAALVVQGCEADIRGEREHALLPPLRALLAARRTAAGRVAAEARGRAKLEALDVQSQGSCTALAASFERCSGLPLMSSPEADVRGQACTNENEKLLGRALQLTAIDDCARAFVAATDHVVALFSFMAQLEKGGLRDEVAHLVLPPPMGEAPLSKSPAAVLEAYANFDVIVLRKDEDGINGGMPQRLRAASAVIQKLQQRQTQHYQGSCGVLAASFERCVALTSTAEFKRNPIAFVPQMKACAAEKPGTAWSCAAAERGRRLRPRLCGGHRQRRSARHVHGATGQGRPARCSAVPCAAAAGGRLYAR